MKYVLLLTKNRENGCIKKDVHINPETIKKAIIMRKL